MLGEGFDDPLFRQTRVSVGVGVRVLIPGLGGLPIALDLSWPLYRQESDDRQVFSFSFKFN
jgi:outer membrane protein assembly factor BamA